ncbi:MAG: O-antigen ligase family protein [Isosphaeraceae bacterium]|nr:O-antigen ligase family protein [Isosphaeraceae bacterium]
MTEGPAPHRWARRCSEAIILILACVAPWAFGSVEAWAELVLDLGIVLVAALGVIAGRDGDWTPNGLFSLPSLALAGLAMLALAQATPLPQPVLDLVDPAAAAARSALIPAAPERVLGDPGVPVALPEATLSLVPEESVHAAARLVAAWVLFQGVLRLGGGHAALRRFGVAMSVNAAALALFALLQALTWDGKIYGFRASPVDDAWRTGGPFVSHNPLAASLNLGLGLALGIGLTAPEPHRRGAQAWAAYAAGLTIVGLVTSQSRSGLVATLGAAAVRALVVRRRGIADAGAAIAGVLALAALLLAVLGGSSPYRRLASLLDASVYADRLEVWAAAIRTWAAHPVLGTGLGSFAVATAPAFGHDRGVVFARAENEYLDLLVEGGVLGLGLALAGLVSVLRSVWRALRAAPTMSDRALVAGGLFGLTALVVQSLADFSPHILGVALPAAVLCGHLCALGDARRGRPAPADVPREAWSLIARLIIAVLGLVLLFHSFHRARAEARLAGSGIPPPGAGRPAAISPSVSKPTLERMRVALEAALRDRPDWGEGHLRLGIVLLGLYERTAAEWVGESLDDPALAARLADPLWLHATVHSAPPSGRGWGEEAIGHEPVRRYLVAAARSFLEARRCSPALAPAHAHLAGLDYLLDGGGATSVHAGRALQLAGSDSRVLLLAAQAAAQAGDLGLAARGWRRCLEVRESNWEDVADAAAVVLDPGQILNEVLPPGKSWPVRFADRLYRHPEDREVRARYLEAALRGLPGDAGLSEPERLRLEAVVRAELGESARPRVLWERALAFEPSRAAWREEFVSWLVERGEIAAAHRHAVLGLRLSPGHPGLERSVLATAEALARGQPTP